MELVLYYSTGDPRMKKQEMMMKSVLVRMGVKIRNVTPDQVLESVGYLAGVPGFGDLKNGKPWIWRKQKKCHRSQSKCWS